MGRRLHHERTGACLANASSSRPFYSVSRRCCPGSSVACSASGRTVMGRTGSARSVCCRSPPTRSSSSPRKTGYRRSPKDPVRAGAGNHRCHHPARVRRCAHRAGYRRSRPEHWLIIFPRHVLAWGLQHCAGWMGVEQQILAAGRIPGSSADAELRGLHGAVADGRGHAGRLVQSARYCRGAGRPLVLHSADSSDSSPLPLPALRNRAGCLSISRRRRTS